MRGPITRCPLGSLAVLGILGVGSAAAQVAGRNVNMVSGTDWPGGDPFLQRQNEPSVAVSTRNPLHLLAGANDYRTVDLPGLPDDKMTGDAWLGVFTSSDGGSTWRSTLVPGYPQQAGSPSPLYGFDAGADPVVRAGPHGLFYYSGIVFDRTNPVLEARRRALGLPARLAGADGSTSAVFVARYIDNNNKENGEPIAYLGATLAARNDDPSVFLDKPWLAVDMPRRGAGTCSITQTLGDRTVTQAIPVGNVYLAYSEFTGSQQQGTSLGKLMFVRSTDCGATWSAPLMVSGNHHINQGATIALDPRTGVIYIVWRRFRWPQGAASPTERDAVLIARSLDRGRTFTAPEVVAELDPFDQGTGYSQFRTNSYPTAGIDRFGRVLVAYSQRGVQQPDGDARIVLTWARYPSRLRALFSSDEDDGTETARAGDARPGWTAPTPVDATNLRRRGHQVMPSMLVTGLRVQIAWVDMQEDHTWGVYNHDATTGQWLEERIASNERQTSPGQVFNNRINDADPQTRRHSGDVWVAQADPGDRLTFAISRASSYRSGARVDDPSLIQQLQFNPPNLPLFRHGQAAFWGDYIDLGGQPLEQKQPLRWRQALQPPAAHVVFTDNRDVRAPVDGDWSSYTPPKSPALKEESIFDPRLKTPICDLAQPEHAGMRNQNVYATRVTQGLHVSAPGNAKPLGRIQRAFVVVAENDTFVAKTFRMSIAAQPTGGTASFRQFTPLTQIDVTIGPRSSVSRSVYVLSTDSRAPVKVDVRETSKGVVVPALLGGLQGSTTLNPDLMNPDLMNPDLMNPGVADVMNAEVYTPDLMNPDLMNPDLMNPDLMNPDLMNPDLMNPDLMNPDLMNPDLMNKGEVSVSELNPDLMNPDLMNPDLMNGALSDTVWTLTNDGNTTAAYDVRLVLRKPVPPGFNTQLLLYKTYLTPVARKCKLTEETQNVLLANIPSPRYDLPGDSLVSDPADGSPKHPTLWLAPGESAKVTLRVYDPDKKDDIRFDPATAVTPAAVPQAVDTVSAAAGVRQPTPTTPGGALLLIEQEPSTTPIGGLVSPIVRVSLQDDGGPIPGATVTLNLISGPPDGSAHGAAAVTDASGIATFLSLWLDRVGRYRLRASAGGREVDALPFDVVPLVVTSTADSGPGTLREAILNANRNAGYADAISFAIPGAAPHTITPASSLPPITDPLTIDGTTQPGFAGTPLVELSGTGVDAGLAISASDSTIRGLAVGGFYWGIRIDGGSNSVVEGSFIGTDTLGISARANHAEGILIVASSNNRIGGLSTGQRNVIAGNSLGGLSITDALSTGNQVVGNYFGTDVTGTARLGTGEWGIKIDRASATVVSENVVAGGFYGIASQGGQGTQIVGNRIGTNAAGTAPLGNNVGISLTSDAIGNIIGGPTAAQRNLISGNTLSAIQIDSDRNRIEGNYIGTNAAGNAPIALPRVGNGVYLRGAENVLIRNVISGQATTGIAIDSRGGNLIEANYIGTNAAGDAALPNRSGLSYFGGAGGYDIIRGNVVSGNDQEAMILTGAALVTVSGNKIGTNLSGTMPLPNATSIFVAAIEIQGCTDSVFGGPTAADGNLLSANAGHGILLWVDSTRGVSNCRIQGNRIGTTLDGASPLGNAGAGVYVAPDSAVPVPMTSLVIDGNLISGNGSDGVRLGDLSHDIVVSNNKIGTNLAGTGGLANAGNGVYVTGASTNANRIEANLISGNGGAGVNLANGSGNQVRGNLIGTNAAGSGGIGNGGNGVTLSGSPLGNIIGGLAAGDGNTIAFNAGSGVQDAAGTTGTQILGNAIFSNTLFGIFGNGRQNSPLLTSANTSGGTTTVTGSLSQFDAPGSFFRLEFFWSSRCDGSGSGEGERLLGRAEVTTDGAGYAPFSVPLGAVSGGVVTATATSPSVGTSGFSACLVPDLASVVGDLRTIVSSEAAYQSYASGWYGTLGCLATPSTCLSGYGGPAFIGADLAALGTRAGYVRGFSAGPEAPSSPLFLVPALQRWAYTAAPENGFGPGYCLQSDVGLFVSTDGMATAENGQCTSGVLTPGP
jgi:pentapeptide MXKDX repeat protein